MIIVLMGYMGSGKSTVGRQLAEVLNYRFVDLDDYIVEKEKTTINAIFQKRGEIYFRKIEASYLKKVITNSDDIILALGGGTPCYGTNLELLLQDKNVKSLYLKLSIPNLVERLFKERSTRPLISHLETKEDLTEFVGKHIFERVQFYNKAEFTIACDNKPEKEITEAILLQLI